MIRTGLSTVVWGEDQVERAVGFRVWYTGETLDASHYGPLARQRG